MPRSDPQLSAPRTEADAHAQADRLECEFPRWWVWVSDTGTWWAARREQLTTAQQNSGQAQFLRADSPEALAGLLKDQETPAEQPDNQADIQANARQ